MRPCDKRALVGAQRPEHRVRPDTEVVATEYHRKSAVVEQPRHERVREAVWAGRSSTARRWQPHAIDASSWERPVTNSETPSSATERLLAAAQRE